MDIDWPALTEAAKGALAHSYSPYSKFPVGVAALVDDGRVITGANIENASYGITLCAECSLVSELWMGAEAGTTPRLLAFACVDGHGNALMPCGRCRQLLFEHSAPGMLLQTVSGIRTIDEVIPDAFGPRTLEAYRG
ncbi:MAG: cytidine deaminase [Microbacteriaceae bacterium]|nr:cytidine deaminase [Microbacteriaceae bacterium]